MPTVDTKVELNKYLELIKSMASAASVELAKPARTSSLAKLELHVTTLFSRDTSKKPFWLRIYGQFAFTPDHAHISPLHFQAARGHSIIVVDNVHLHLVWYYDRIFIKPIPAYLLSSAFWDYAEMTNEPAWRAAADFMRTYAYLIKYEVDFRKAQSTELGLIPTHDGKHPITFERFAQFIALFVELDDASVAPRYHYGEMRLNRLN